MSVQALTSLPDRLNLTDMLDQQFSVGPFDLSLQDIKWPDSIQDKLDIIIAT